MKSELDELDLFLDLFLEDIKKDIEEFQKDVEKFQRLHKYHFKEIRKLKNNFLNYVNGLPIIPCDNPSKIIVFDTETTGLNFCEDEIIQLSIIDGNGNELFNKYIKPYWKKSWYEAEKINGISPTMVENAPYPHEVLREVKGIFESADLLVAYNYNFDIQMLENWGIEKKETQEVSDVMLDFAPIFAEWNEKYGNFKWQKLITCAKFFEYDSDFSDKAHDSLEDVRATLYCFNKIKEVKAGKYDVDKCREAYIKKYVKPDGNSKIKRIIL